MKNDTITNGEAFRLAAELGNLDALRGACLDGAMDILQDHGIGKGSLEVIVSMLSVMDLETIVKWMEFASTDGASSDPMPVVDKWVEAWSAVTRVN